MKYKLSKVPPPPWVQGENAYDLRVFGPPDQTVVSATNAHIAAHVVHCVNMHEEMVRTLEGAARCLFQARKHTEDTGIRELIEFHLDAITEAVVKAKGQ